MYNLSLNPQFSTSQSKNGSALLLTLLVVSLLLIISLAFTVFVRTELRTVENFQNREIARKHAQLALQLAINNLQIQTGPDQRITARANILVDAPSEAGSTLSYSLPSLSATLASQSDKGAQAKILVDQFWHRRNRHWTGAWIDRNIDASFDPEDPIDSVSDPALLGWLVSGTDPDPTSTLSSLSVNSTGTSLLSPGSTNPGSVLLVAPAKDINGNIPDDVRLRRAVTAPRVALEETRNGLTKVKGHFAWWVGDEGTKARGDLADPFEGSSDANERLDRVASAQRSGIEAMTGGVGANAYQSQDGLEAYQDLVNHPQLEKFNTLREFSFLKNDSHFQQNIFNHLHDLTLHSMGVLSDVKHGGLKQDLSYILGQESISDLRHAVNAAYDDNTVMGSGDYNPIFKPAATPLAEVPAGSGTVGWKADFIMTNYGDTDVYDENSILGAVPTWERLWSFYHMGNDTTDTPPGVWDAAKVSPREMSNDQQGIVPMLVQAKIFYGLYCPSSSENVYLDAYPVAVLANPYAVPIDAQAYTLRFSKINGSTKVSLHFSDSSAESSFDLNNDDRKVELLNAGLKDIELVIQSGIIQPGEAQVFTLKKDYDSGPENNRVEMVNDAFAPLRVRIDTGASYPHTDPADPGSPLLTHVGLYYKLSISTRLNMRLYLRESLADSDPYADEKLISTLSTQEWTSDEYTSEFLVNPTTIGPNESQGGGLGFKTWDGFTQVNPGLSTLKKTIFGQMNFRSTAGDTHGSSGGLEARTNMHIKKGDPSNFINIEDNLMMKTTSLGDVIVRWGPIQTGVGATVRNTAPAGLESTEAGYQNILYDLPLPGRKPISLGYLQHFDIGAPTDVIASKSYAVLVQMWQNNYSISNSYLHPHVHRDMIFDNSISTGIGYHYDGSYLWNHILWDRFYFSSFPGSGAFDFSTDSLPNSRYVPFRTPADVAYDDESSFRGVDPSRSESSRIAAQNLMVKGAFNINSTSPEAWKALFASLRDTPVGSETDSDNLTGPFLRSLVPTGSSENATDAESQDAWSGFRNLSQTEIEDLADEMVLQVQLRGPFTSMADFVNRRLTGMSYSDDDFNLGGKGALQSAIDAAVNANISLPTAFDHNLDANYLVDEGARWPQGSIGGFPGYLLQGDVLTAVGQYLTARSDTFTIRAYGDAATASDSPDNILARAWCEAVVQRVPDYYSETDDPVAPPSNPINVAFGRKYKIISFRWLNTDEI
ncbi:hypothetical protein P0Y35_07035 [Kiritimatiellaeota bacterium B1221]|nr:hypothetical protein [Kiritimatiellaeota bacterium B1221]